MLSEQELRARLHFWRAAGIGPTSMRRIVEFFGGAHAALRASDNALREAGLKATGIAAYRALAQGAADVDWQWLNAAEHHHIVSIDEANYPALLKNIRHAPPLLFVMGNPSALNDPQIAMVGSRNPTVSGKENAHAFAQHFAENGLSVTSGLATGIDTHSHEGCLSVNGTTFAVVGNGLDIQYPLRNRELAHRIQQHGAIISEFPIGTPAHPQHFPRRNRIISGMAYGVLVVEAGIQSGTLITARHAMEQGRDVFAIPGSIHNPLARGCHHLIRQGAKLVETARDVLEEIAPHLHAWLTQHAKDSSHTTTPAVSTTHVEYPETLLDPEYQHVMVTLNHEPLPIDQIILNTGLTAETVSSILLMLELQGLVTACGGGHYMRSRPLERIS